MKVASLVTWTSVWERWQFSPQWYKNLRAGSRLQEEAKVKAKLLAAVTAPQVGLEGRTDKLIIASKFLLPTILQDVETKDSGGGFNLSSICGWYSVLNITPISQKLLVL